jgi:hypothetical protein
MAQDDKQWRLDNARHLLGLTLQWRSYQAWSSDWDHDHCAACSAKFMEGNAADTLHEGFATRDDYPKGAGYEWVCRHCFEDLKLDMRWSCAD